MNQSDLNVKSSGASERMPKRGSPWLIVTWIRSVLGLALIAEGGVLYVHARAYEGPLWLVGVVAILVGAVLAFPGMSALCTRSRATEMVIVDQLPVGGDASIPMLGALLVYKYKLITEEHLQQALEEQRKDGESKRLLGGILLDLGLLSVAELQTALDYQRSLTSKQTGASETSDEGSDDEGAGDDARCPAAVGGEASHAR